jgi:hypothetical protein
MGAWGDEASASPSAYIYHQHLMLAWVPGAMKGARSMSCAVLRADCCNPLLALYTSIYISSQDVSVCVHTWSDERGAVDELCRPEGRLL